MVCQTFDIVHVLQERFCLIIHIDKINLTKKKEGKKEKDIYCGIWAYPI